MISISYHTSQTLERQVLAGSAFLFGSHGRVWYEEGMKFDDQLHSQSFQSTISITTSSISDRDRGIRLPPEILGNIFEDAVDVQYGQRAVVLRTRAAVALTSSSWRDAAYGHSAIWSKLFVDRWSTSTFLNHCISAAKQRDLIVEINAVPYKIDSMGLAVACPQIEALIAILQLVGPVFPGVKQLFVRTVDEIMWKSIMGHLANFHAPGLHKLVSIVDRVTCEATFDAPPFHALTTLRLSSVFQPRLLWDDVRRILQGAPLLGTLHIHGIGFYEAPRGPPVVLPALRYLCVEAFGEDDDVALAFLDTPVLQFLRVEFHTQSSADGAYVLNPTLFQTPASVSFCTEDYARTTEIAYMVSSLTATTHLDLRDCERRMADSLLHLFTRDGHSLPSVTSLILPAPLHDVYAPILLEGMAPEGVLWAPEQDMGGNWVTWTRESCTTIHRIVPPPSPEWRWS
ncbi:hypothetical protein DFH07DRAFT_783397 [Mycena maculata]|uniref:F-box domain-containing protein n=1 Tax=Mycena maculata TaxID=230809 RepID=A0AAD7HNK4_9AGAR|nr:hypothetical protein DFH07DRAFT_783397 [Mycena maculata]